MRLGAYFLLLIAVLGWHGCRPAKPVVTKRPPVSPTRPAVAAAKPMPQKPVVVKRPPPKPVPAIVESPIEPVEFDEVTDLPPPPPKREFRAVWIATVENMDWPSKKGLPVADQQRELIEMFDMHQRMGLNAVIFQIRSAADAFYAKSSGP